MAIGGIATSTILVNLVGFTVSWTCCRTAPLPQCGRLACPASYSNGGVPAIAATYMRTVECPLIVYTDLDRSLCKALEETLLMGVEHSSRTL